MKLLATVDLGPEIEKKKKKGMAGRQLRMRMVTIERRNKRKTTGGAFGPITNLPMPYAARHNAYTSIA